MVSYNFDYSRFAEKMTELYAGMGPRAMLHIVRDVAIDATEMEMDAARRIINDETNGTGRLAASMGKFNREWLKGPSPDAGPRDAHWEEFFDEDEFYIVAGSNVEYAAAINYGFTQEDTRKVYLQDEGRWVTVKPFTFGGVHFLERAAGEVTAEKEKIDQIVARNLQKRVIGWEVR